VIGDRAGEQQHPVVRRRRVAHEVIGLVAEDERRVVAEDVDVDAVEALAAMKNSQSAIQRLEAYVSVTPLRPLHDAELVSVMRTRRCALAACWRITANRAPMRRSVASLSRLPSVSRSLAVAFGHALVAYAWKLSSPTRPFCERTSFAVCRVPAPGSTSTARQPRAAGQALQAPGERLELAQVAAQPVALRPRCAGASPNGRPVA
jgi:hypothetical protein